MTKEELAKHSLTIQDSEFFDTVKGNTLFTNTKRVDSQNSLKSSIPVPPEQQLRKENSEMGASMQSSNIFNLSNDSSIRMPDTFLSSFVTTMDGKGNSTFKSAASSAFNDSLGYSNTGLTFHKETSKCIPMEVIKSEEGDSSSKAEHEEPHDDFPDSDREEDIERFEEVDVKEVDIDTITKSKKRKQQKAFLSPEEIEQAHKEREEDFSTSNRTHAEYVLQCHDFIESGKYNLEDFKQAMGMCLQIVQTKSKKSNQLSIGSTSLYESMEILNVTTKEGFNNYIETQLLKFHPNYDFDVEEMLDKDMCNSSLALMETFVSERPTQEEIYYYAKYIVLSSRMEKEIPLVALAYIERILTKVGILMNHWNWRRIMLISLIIASKIWDDESLENVHFPKAMPELSIKEINQLEKIFLDLIGYDLVVKGSDHAKYYFILRAMAKEFENPTKIQMDPISFEDMKKLQKNSDKAEDVLREIYRYNDFSASL